MATKSKKATGKKSSGKVRDLTARKDPKGGAQKKEIPLTLKGGGVLQGQGKRRLS